jgi:hypothetical protein
MTSRIAAALVVFGLAVIRITPLAAEMPAAPIVVELFTSQSCSSCPPAEAYLGKLAGRPDLVALEFLVDYWNDLVDGAAGRWTDVHSDPAYTARQRVYAGRLPSSFGGVYTPQMVIDGRFQAVGTRAREVEAAIAAARQSPHLALTLATLDTVKTELRVSGGAAVMDRVADIWLVRFRARAETKIRAGENRGKTLVNHHIVTDMTRLGGWVLDRSSIILDSVSHGLDGGCAVLIQAPKQGPILGAAMCPNGAGQAS